MADEKGKPKEKNPERPLGAKKDVWDKIQIGMPIFITAVLGVLGVLYTNSTKNREMDLKYVELAIGILSDKPTDESQDLRQWAVGIVNRYSTEKLSVKTQKDLINKIPVLIETLRDGSLWDTIELKSKINIDSYKRTIEKLEEYGKKDTIKTPETKK
jgi:hypothetical protein